MPPTRTLLLLLLSLSFVTTAWAQGSGVLLGVAVSTAKEGSDTQDFASIYAPRYQTLWIAPDPTGELKVLASLPELVVPRRDGFWHVGAKQVCEFSDKNESLRQAVWAAPVSKAGEVEQIEPCTSHKPEDYAGPNFRSEEDKDKISQCGFSLVDIEYLSPELMSISAYSSQSEDCEPRGGHYSQDYYVRRFDSDHAIAFSQLLGPSAHTAYIRALPKQARNDGGDDCGEPSGADDSGWGIVRERGRWRPHLHENLGNFGCSADATVNVPIPSSLTGDTSAVLPWKFLQSKISGIEDAYLSPAADLLIAVTHSEVKFYEVRDGVPGKLLLTLPGSGIVMAQWATGKHVQDWTAQVGSLAQQHLPEPVIRVKPVSH
jgi:hypothetical protein